jgi:hypothetical protein
MPSPEERGLADRLRAACALHDLSLALMRQRFRREFPTESAAEIEGRLLAWRLYRDDAPHGDGVGRPVRLPRARS